MVEYIQLTTVFHSQSDRAGYSCFVFLCVFSSSFLSSPALLLRIVRRRRLLGLCEITSGLCRPGLKQHGTTEVHVHTPTRNPTDLFPYNSQLGGEGETSPNKKGQNDNIEKTGNPKTLSVSNHLLSLVPAVALERVNRSNGHLEYSEYQLWPNVSFLSSWLLICSCKVTV